MTSESLLTFNKKFGVHAVNVVGGFTYDKVMWRSKYLRSSKYPSDGNEENNIGAGVEGREMTSDRGRSQLMSYLVRGNYNLLDRYMLTFSFRRDGSVDFLRWIVGVTFIRELLRGVYPMKHSSNH